MGEEKRPSSLRTRIERTRSTYNRGSDPMPMVIGAIFVLIGGIVLYVVAFSTPPTPIKRPNSDKTPRELLEQPANPNMGAASGRQVMPQSDSQKVYVLIDTEKRNARGGNIDKAIATLQQNIGKYANYDGEIYFAMGMCISYRETKVSGEARAQVYAQKADYFEKALSEFEAGGKFVYGKKSQRIQNLKQSISQARSRAN